MLLCNLFLSLWVKMSSWLLNLFSTSWFKKIVFFLFRISTRRKQKCSVVHQCMCLSGTSWIAHWWCKQTTFKWTHDVREKNILSVRIGQHGNLRTVMASSQWLTQLIRLGGLITNACIHLISELSESVFCTWWKTRLWWWCVNLGIDCFVKGETGQNFYLIFGTGFFLFCEVSQWKIALLPPDRCVLSWPFSKKDKRTYEIDLNFFFTCFSVSHCVNILK